MIEILLKNNEIIKVNSLDELSSKNIEFHIMQVIDFNEEDLTAIHEKFGVDFSIMKQYEDIEISSHFLTDAYQLSLNVSLPYFNDEQTLIEAPVFFIITSRGLFFFSNAKIDFFLNKMYTHKFQQLKTLSDIKEIFKFQIEFISDFYADITEIETKIVKTLANTILLKKEFSNEVTDQITKHNFNNLLLKESLIETTRVFHLLRKSQWEQKLNIRNIIESELNDLSVISDYIQFNFDRLDDLKENVSNKIDLEQNYIFKMLTVVTVCISLPTFIAGVYGMNFDYMPELKTTYGYPVALFAMIISSILPFIYFKRKKWL